MPATTPPPVPSRVISAVRTVSEDDDFRVIEGLAVPFGGPFNGRDTYGTFFSVRTDLGLAETPTPIKVWYHHGLDPDFKFSTLGTALPMRTDSDGVWVQAQLDKRHRYYETRVKPLLDDPRGPQLGLSAGSAEHSYRDDRRTGELLDYPIHEISLTPTESNPFAFIAARSDEMEQTLVRIVKAVEGDEPPATATPETTPAPAAIRGIQTFADIAAAAEMSEELPEAFQTLTSAIYSAIYAVDAEYNALPADEKRTAIQTSLDQFRDCVLAILDSAAPDSARSGEMFLSAIRAGKRHSSSDAGHIASAHDHLVALGAHDTTSATETPDEGDDAAARTADAAAQPAARLVRVTAVRSDAPDETTRLIELATEAGAREALRLIGR